MATLLSDSEVAKLVANEETAGAILDPVSSSETFPIRLGKLVTGGVENINALSGNIIDTLVNGTDSPMVNRISAASDEIDKGNLGSIADVLKSPFGDTESGVVDALFGKDASKDLNTAFKEKEKKLNVKAETGGQYSGGGLGNVAAEVVASVPIAKFGTMSNTMSALKSNVGKVEVAKALTKDMAKNTLSLGASELALAKLYGKSDAEATSDAMIASMMGLGGTPIVGGVLGIGKKISKEFSPLHTVKEPESIKEDVIPEHKAHTFDETKAFYEEKGISDPEQQKKQYAGEVRILSTADKRMDAASNATGIPQYGIKDKFLSKDTYDKALKSRHSYNDEVNKPYIDAFKNKRMSANEANSYIKKDDSKSPMGETLYRFKISDLKKNGEIPKRYSNLFDAITEEVGDINVKVTAGSKGASGMYSQIDGTISVSNLSFASKRPSKTLAHEMIHAATFKKLRQNPAFAKEAQQLLDEARDIIKNDNRSRFKEMLSEDSNKNLKGKLKERVYGLENIDELMAESQTNKVFRQLLSPEILKDKSMFGKIKSFIYKILGKRTRKDVLGDIDNLLNDIRKYDSDKMTEKTVDSGGDTIGSAEKSSIVTKSGREFESEDVAESKKNVEDVEFDVVTPVPDRKPIEGNIYTPIVKNPKKIKYGYDDRGRVYNEESSLLGVQGTAEQKASLKIREKGNITNANEEVARRLEFYDKEASLRKAYGQNEAKFKSKDNTSGDIKAIKRREFIKDQYADIMKNKNLDSGVRDNARDTLSKLNKTRIKKRKISDDIKAKAEKKYDSQTRIKSPNKATRDSELREQYTHFKANRGDKEGFTRKATKTDEETISTVHKKATNSARSAKDAKNKIIEAEQRLGKTGFNEADITDAIRRKYPTESKIIEDFQARREDLGLYRRGKLDIEEFRFRELRRIEDEFSADNKNFKSKEEAEEFASTAVKRLDDIGIYQDKKKVKPSINDKPKSDKPEDPIKKQKREAKELEKATYQHEFLAGVKGVLQRYRTTGKNPRGKDGKPILTKSQIRDVDESILTNTEIANKTSPITINSKRNDAINKARAYASKKVNTQIKDELGIKGRFKTPENIKFSDTVLDASNSVAQITTVLLGSKRMAKLSKLYNTEADIRDIIAAEMKAKGFSKASKATIKPLFMTKNYGQMRKGLVNNTAKNMKISKAEAEEFVDAFYAASKTVAPEMEELSNAIFKTFQDGKKTDFKWTLPDGFEVGFKLNKTKDGKIVIQGKDYKVKIETDELDEFARALMPNIIHSVDAYVARHMNKKGIPTVHDAYIIPKGKEAFAKNEYDNVMVKLNESDLLDEIMRDIGYKGKSLKVGDLDSEMIRKSQKSLSVEHESGKGLDSDEFKASHRTLDVSTQSTPIDVMKDFMASGNYRQIKTTQLIDSMVNEAGFNNEFIRLAREGDDPFERQIALAMQGNRYTPIKAIPVPDGVHAGVWNKAQREIFEEARAKIEYNPFLHDAIKGKRKYFDKNHNPIGVKTKTMQQLLNEEMRIARKLMKNKSKKDKKILGNPAKAIKTASKMERNKPYSFDKMKAKEFMDEVRTENVTPKSSSFKTLWNEQNSTSNVYNEFNAIESMRNIFKSEVERSTEILYKKIDKMNPEKKSLIKRLVDSDYEAIRGMDEATAKKIWDSNKQLRDIAYKEINQMAKGIGNSSEQYGSWVANAGLVVKRYNLHPDDAKVIDQLVSIKAMKDNDGWTSVRSLKDDADTKFVLDVIATKRKNSEDIIFDSNPDKIIKGYQAEVYRGNKKINEDNTISYDADSKYEDGVLGSELENNKIGTLYKDEPPKFDSTPKGLADELAWMNKNRLRKTNGQYRKVPTRKIKLEAGLSEDLADIIAETHRGVTAKIKERGIIDKVMTDISNDSLLYSANPKDGMIKLSDKQLSRLPFELRTSMKYVNEEFLDKLIGRDELRLYNGSNDSLKIADRLWSNLGTAFKQNVVLKNPTSYLNSLLFNQTIGLSVGATPKELYQSQKNCIADIAEMKGLIDSLTRQKLTGEKLNRAISTQLKNNRLFQMERAGLSTNRVDGVVGDDDLLGSMLKDHVPSPIFKIGRVLNLNQNTTIGSASLRAFSNIDTMGRYAVVDKLMKDGMSMKDAAKEANGLFGDMDKMVPPSVEMLDKYGLVPFLKWYTLTSPKLLQLTKNNPKKALAVAVGTYMLGSETDTNLSTVNPLEAMIDFGEQSLPFETIEKMEHFGVFDTFANRASSTVVPKYIPDYLNGKTISKLRKSRIHENKYGNGVDFRGFTQQIIEGSENE